MYGAPHTKLRMTGIYRFVRHPQYLGLMLVIVALNIRWPTIPTPVIAPILIVMYARRARRAARAVGSGYSRSSITSSRARPPHGRIQTVRLDGLAIEPEVHADPVHGLDMLRALAGQGGPEIRAQIAAVQTLSTTQGIFFDGIDPQDHCGTFGARAPLADPRRRISIRTAVLTLAFVDVALRLVLNWDRLVAGGLSGVLHCVPICAAGLCMRRGGGGLGGNEVFWKYTDAVFEHTQSNGKGLPADHSEAALAARIGLNGHAFADCMKDPAMAKRVDEDFADGAAVRITGTPTTLIRNNRTGATEVVVGARSSDFIAPIIESALGAKRESAR